MLLRAKSTLRSLVRRPCYRLINHKFYFGQGGVLRLNLTKRRYEVTLETIWEDHSLVEIQGLTGIKNYAMQERQRQCVIDDSDLDANLDQGIRLRLKIPEDFTYLAKVFGKMSHIDGSIPSKLRSNGTVEVAMLGANSLYRAINLQADKLKILSPESTVDIGQLLVGTASVQCNDFTAMKVSIAKRLDLKAMNSIRIRSLIMQQSDSSLQARHCQIESIMGKATIDSSLGLKIKRWYAPENGIQVLSNNYLIGIETGTGVLDGFGVVNMGKSHKGSKMDLPDGKTKILSSVNDLQ